MNSVVVALTAVINAATFSSVGRQRLVSLVQSRQTSDDDDGGELSDLAAAYYRSHRADIIYVLDELQDGAQPKSTRLTTPCRLLCATTWS